MSSDLRIVAVEVIPVAIPLRHTLKMAVATVGRRESVIIRIRSEGGLDGLGEAITAPYFTGEDQAGAVHLVEQLLGPALAGSDASDLHAAHRCMDRLLAGNPALKAGIDIALHDLVARALGVPLYRLLGGCTRQRVLGTWYLSATTPQEAAEQAREGAAQGFGALKVKVGTGPPEEDLQRLQAVRLAVGEHMALRADANQAWTPKEAMRFLRAAEELRLEFLEQPVARGDVAGMARVARAVATPIAPDEGLGSAADALRYIRAGAADGLVMKLLKSGGLAGARQLAAVAEAGGLSVHLGGMPGETSIYAAATLHLAVALPQLHWGAGIYPDLAALDVVAEPLRAAGGAFTAGDAPGLGVDLDMEALERCRVDR